MEEGRGFCLDLRHHSYIKGVLCFKGPAEQIQSDGHQGSRV